MFHLSQQRFNLGRRRHGRRALETGRDDRARRVREPQHPLERPAGQQPVTQRAAEAVAAAAGRVDAASATQSPARGRTPGVEGLLGRGASD